MCIVVVVGSASVLIAVATARLHFVHDGQPTAGAVYYLCVYVFVGVFGCGCVQLDSTLLYSTTHVQCWFEGVCCVCTAHTRRTCLCHATMFKMTYPNHRLPILHDSVMNCADVLCHGLCTLFVRCLQRTACLVLICCMPPAATPPGRYHTHTHSSAHAPALPHCLRPWVHLAALNATYY